MKQLDEYVLQKVIGKGIYGEVYLTLNKNTNQLYATKKMSRNLFDDEKKKKYVNNEILIIKSVSHPNIMKFIELKKTKDNLYAITEYINGGSLSQVLDYNLDRTSKPLSEEIVQHLGRQICSALQYLHNHNILHRDLKLDNILIHFNDLKDKDDFNLLKAQVKLIDFGFARYLTKTQMAQSVLGSPLYMDPRILNKVNKFENNNSFGYDEKADIWSLGALFFKLLVGVTPFNSDTHEGLYEKIMKGMYKIPNSLKLSKQAISFINTMLQYNPSLRADINQLANHDFLIKPVSSFDQLNLVKAEKMFDNKDEIMLNVNQGNNIWFIFENIEEEVDIEQPLPLNLSKGKVVNIEKESIIDNEQDFVGVFADGFKNVLKPLIIDINANVSIADNKKNSIEHKTSDINGDVLNTNNISMTKGQSTYIISNEDKDMLDQAFYTMNNDSYALEPMFIPVIPSKLDEVFEFNV